MSLYKSLKMYNNYLNMTMQDILAFDEEARQGLRNGVDKIANSVKVTMGPGGRFVILAQLGMQPPIVTKDGFSVAKYMKLIDPIEKMGADLIKQTSQKTVTDVGDGTTTATVLTQALVKHNPKNLAKFKVGMEEAKQDVLKILNDNKITDINVKILYQIALTSSNDDNILAEIVSEVVHNVGKDGIIKVEESELNTTTFNIENGFKFQQGLPSSQFISNQDNGYCELKDGWVLLLKEKLEVFDHIQKIASLASQKHKFLLVIAPEFSQTVIDMSAENCRRKLVPIIPIRTPEFGERMLSSLEDLALYCDGDIFTIQDLKYGSEQKLGQIDKIKSNIKGTTVFNEGSQSLVMQRIKQLQNLIDEAENNYDIIKLKERIARLSAGFATIKVGGFTPAEIKERFDRYEDAVGACSAAQQYGILPGGGVALMRAYEKLVRKEPSNEEQELAGYDAVINSLLAPISIILENSNLNLNDFDANIEFKTIFNMGINAATGKVINMIEEGIIDPYRVTESALINAVSTAGMILSVGCVIDNNRINIDLNG